MELQEAVTTFMEAKMAKLRLFAMEQIPKLNPFAKEFVPIPSASESFFHVGDLVDQDVFSGNNNSRSGSGSGQKGTGSSNLNIKAGSSSKATASPARNGNGSSKSWQLSGAMGATPLGGKKNQSLRANHLLNFQYDPIVRPPPRSHQPPSRRQRRAQPYNKELFLQANFRFLVSDLGDYVLNASDPDTFVQAS